LQQSRVGKVFPYPGKVCYSHIPRWLEDKVEAEPLNFWYDVDLNLLEASHFLERGSALFDFLLRIGLPSLLGYE